MRLMLALLASLAATPAFANALTLIGALDGRDIQVELTEPSHGAVAGRYTFTDDGADIPLRPVSSDGKVWTLAEEAMCSEGTCIADEDGFIAEPPIAATWTITYDPDLYMARVVRAPAGAGKKRAFELSVLAWRKFADEPTAFDLHDRSARLSYDATLPLDWKHAPYEMLLLDVAPELAEIVENNGVHWGYATDERSGLTFPRLVLMTPEIDTLLTAMDAHFYRMSLAALDCKAFRYASYGANEYSLGQGGHTAGYEDEQVTLSYISPTLASWSQSGSLYCQGAHPYNHLDNYTLDGRSGEALDWRQVFSAIVPRPWFAPLDEVADLDTALSDAENYAWGPSLDFIAFIQQRRAPNDDAELDQICGSDEAIAEHLSMRVIGDSEIMFTLAGFPHVSSICNGDIFSATLDELTPFLADTARDYFPALTQ